MYNKKKYGLNVIGSVLGLIVGLYLIASFAGILVLLIKQQFDLEAVKSLIGIEIAAVTYFVHGIFLIINCIKTIRKPQVSGDMVFERSGNKTCIGILAFILLADLAMFLPIARIFSPTGVFVVGFTLSGIETDLNVLTNALGAYIILGYVLIGVTFFALIFKACAKTAKEKTSAYEEGRIYFITETAKPLLSISQEVYEEEKVEQEKPKEEQVLKVRNDAPVGEKIDELKRIYDLGLITEIEYKRAVDVLLKSVN